MKKTLLFTAIAMLLASCNNKPVELPAVTTGDMQIFASSYTATCSGEVISDGGGKVSERGICYTAGTAIPDISSPRVTAGSGTGQYFCSLPNITAGDWTYRAYATNETGTAYGEAKTFEMPTDDPFVGTWQLTAVSAPFGKRDKSKTDMDTDIQIDHVKIFPYTDTDGTEWYIIESMLGTGGDTHPQFSTAGKRHKVGERDVIRLGSNTGLGKLFVWKEQSCYAQFFPMYFAGEDVDNWLYEPLENGETWLWLSSDGYLILDWCSECSDTQSQMATAYCFRYYNASTNQLIRQSDGYTMVRLKRISTRYESELQGDIKINK